MPMPSRPLEERLKLKLEEDENGCWVWQGQKYQRYGTLKEGPSRKQIGAHRAAYLVWRGEIPPGMYVCHKCDVPKCCNPEHLFLGTAKENSEDCSRKNRWRPAKGTSHYLYKHGRYSEYASTVQPKEPRTHCKNEHELTPENCYVHKGHRICRICSRAAKRRYLQRKASTDR